MNNVIVYCNINNNMLLRVLSLNDAPWIIRSRGPQVHWKTILYYCFALTDIYNCTIIHVSDFAELFGFTEPISTISVTSSGISSSFNGATLYLEYEGWSSFCCSIQNSAVNGAKSSWCPLSKKQPHNMCTNQPLRLTLGFNILLCFCQALTPSVCSRMRYCKRKRGHRRWGKW